MKSIDLSGLTQWTRALVIVAAFHLAGTASVVSGGVQFSGWALAALMQCRDLQACAVLQATGGRKQAWRHSPNQGVSRAICWSGPMMALVTSGMKSLTVMMAVGAALMLRSSLLP